MGGTVKMGVFRYRGIEIEYSPDGGFMQNLRLSVSYDPELYFDCDTQEPEHPDRQIEMAVGARCSDGGMGCGRRDQGWEHFSGSVADVTAALLMLPFPVEVKWTPKKGE
jgi:hypothetical protein